MADRDVQVVSGASAETVCQYVCRTRLRSPQVKVF